LCILSKNSGDDTIDPVQRVSVYSTFRTHDLQILNPDKRPPVFKPD